MAKNGVTLKVVREVNLAALMASEVREFLEDVMHLAHGEVSQPGRVPFREGYLAGSLSPGAGVTMVDKSSMPTFAEVGTNKVYAGPLEDGEHPVSGTTMHYRGGPSKGQPTKGWLSKTVQNVASDVGGLLGDMADRLERGWNG